MQKILTADSFRNLASSCRQSNTTECPVLDGVDDGVWCCELGRSRNDGAVVASYNSRCSFRAVITALFALKYKPISQTKHIKTLFYKIFFHFKSYRKHTSLKYFFFEIVGKTKRCITKLKLN